MQAEFDAFRVFDYSNANIFLWVFKASTTANKFSARFVQTDETLNEILRSTVQREVVRLTEFAQYSHLAQTNENSCLTSPVTGSDFSSLKALVDRPEPEWRVRSIRDLKGATGYVVKFAHNGQTVYAVKRSAESWKTSYPKKFINIVFENDELSAATDNAFSIERTFDFYSLNDILFIVRKNAFESAMRHRMEYARAFAGLQQSAPFSAIFTTMQPLVTYVGTNSMQLKRMATIEQKAIYFHPQFLPTLRTVSIRRGYGLNFDSVSNQIVPCDQTAKIIIQVLLDHRLHSEITDSIYDVPDAIRV